MLMCIHHFAFAFRLLIALYKGKCVKFFRTDFACVGGTKKSKLASKCLMFNVVGGLFPALACWRGVAAFAMNFHHPKQT